MRAGNNSGSSRRHSNTGGFVSYVPVASILDDNGHPHPPTSLPAIAILAPASHLPSLTSTTTSQPAVCYTTPDQAHFTVGNGRHHRPFLRPTAGQRSIPVVTVTPPGNQPPVSSAQLSSREHRPPHVTTSFASCDPVTCRHRPQLAVSLKSQPLCCDHLASDHAVTVIYRGHPPYASPSRRLFLLT